MEIKGFMESSFVDWDGKISSLVFTPGCNFRCPYCYNHELVYDAGSYDTIPKEPVFHYLEEHSDFIDGVVVVGGEPTIHSGDLVEFCRQVKDRGLKVKLDTNGTRSEVLKELLNENLVDYIAMDVKAPLEPEKYSRLAGVDVEDELESIRESIRLIMDSGVEYEFRTTCVPGLHSPEDIEAIGREIEGARIYVLQKFAPLNIRDDEFKDIPPPSDEDMDLLVEKAKPFVKSVKWRGK